MHCSIKIMGTLKGIEQNIYHKKKISLMIYKRRVILMFNQFSQLII